MMVIGKPGDIDTVIEELRQKFVIRFTSDSQRKDAASGKRQEQSERPGVAIQAVGWQTVVPGQLHTAGYRQRGTLSRTPCWIVHEGEFLLCEAGIAILGGDLDVAMGTVGLKLMDGTSVTLSDVLYIPEVDGSIISVAKLAEKDVVAHFSKGNCDFRYSDATIMEAKRCGNVYKLKRVGHAATTSRKGPWTIVHARLSHIPYKRYEQILTMVDGVPIMEMRQVAKCAGCCMCKMREDNFPSNPKNTVKSAGVLDLIHSDAMGPMQTKTPGGCTYTFTFIDDFSRYITVGLMKKKTQVVEKFKMF
ncbi:unnamed protein product [Phytophthora fragariaefolia]|uniref:Unnamed protein product n=1 Tax=Phytophthora fragariaefolia TaxID=1490495 RepID=A0A9W7DBS0_9STRA|nr:unnamed protein product [Phytophthora fragariaefolia]